MEEDKVFSEELAYFRWILYHHSHTKGAKILQIEPKSRSEKSKDSNDEIIGSIIRYHCERMQSNSQAVAEELVIANYRIETVKSDVSVKLYGLAPWLNDPGKIPSLLSRDDRFWDINRLFICLLYENESAFTKGLDLVAEKRPYDLCKLLISIEFLVFQLKLKSSTHEILDRAIGLIRNAKNLGIQKGLSEYDQCIQLFRNSLPNACASSVVDLIECTKLYKQQLCNQHLELHIDFDKCLTILVDYDSKIVAECNSSARTAMHYAVQSNDLQTTSKLLMNGAYIGMDGQYFSRSAKNCISIQNVPAKVLERHFDSCITMAGDHIEVNFKNLITPSSEMSDCVYPHELNVIEFMSTSSDYKHLLFHPLIKAFVVLKWNRLSTVLYIDFMLHMLLTLSTVGYIMLLESESIYGEYMLPTLRIVISTLTAYLAIRRILQQLFWPRRKDRDNYLQLLRTALTVGFVVPLLLSAYNRNCDIYATICILVTSIELFIQAGAMFWDFSKYYVMFLDVTWSSIKSLQLCAILLPAFCVSFFLLLRHPGQNQRLEYTQEKNGSGEEATENSFSRLGSSLIKIIVMSTGEFDADDSSFDLNVMSMILFVCFLFLISTAFMNLMNGLAVGDTQKIECNAELTCMQQRCRILARYEDILSNQQHWFTKYFPVTDLIFKYLTAKNSLEGLSRPLNTKIYISPKRYVVISPNRYRGTSYHYGTSMDDDCVVKLYSSVGCFPFLNKRLRMDRKFMQQARAISDKNDMAQVEENGNEHFKGRIDKLEYDLEQMMQFLKRSEDSNRHHLDTILMKMNDLLVCSIEQNARNQHEIAELKAIISAFRSNSDRV